MEPRIKPVSRRRRCVEFCQQWGLSFLAVCLATGIGLNYAEARSVAQDALPGVLTFHEGNLTAKLSAAPLKLVMQEIGALSGAEIVWLQDGMGTVSVDFNNVPLARALRLILGEKNFLLFYSSADEEGRLSQIWISSGEETQATAITARPVSVTLLRQWHQMALRGADVSLCLKAVEQLQRQAHVNEQAKQMLTHVARWAAHPQVRQAAATGATTQARK